MKIPQLVILFRSLNNVEVKKFGQFLKSPYYNATPKMLALYKYLKKTHPECSFEQADKERLFGQFFKHEPYNIKKMNNLTAALSRILQDFLLIQQNKSGTFVRDFNLFNVYSGRRLNDLSEKKLLALKKVLNHRAEHSMAYYYHQLRVHHELYFHPNTLKQINIKQGEIYLDEIFHNLDLFYVHARLHHLCEQNFRSKVVATTTKYETDKISKLEQFISLKSTPLLEIYKLLYRIQISPDKEGYIDLREKVFAYLRQQNPKHRDSLLTSLTNYQAERTKEGDMNALSEILNIYKFGFEEDIYITDTGCIESGHFVNVSILAAELGEIDWLTQFIENQQSKLQKDVRKNTINLCMAYLNFAKGKYDKAISLAIQVKRQFPNQTLSCWTLEIRAHYKTQNSHDYLEEILRNFTAYLRRHDKLIPDYIMAANRNFIKIIRQLAQAAYNDNYTKERLATKLEAMENIVCKYWLTQEIKGLK